MLIQRSRYFIVGTSLSSSHLAKHWLKLLLCLMMMGVCVKFPIIFILVLAVTPSLAGAALTFSLPSTEYNTLYDLYNRTDGGNWKWRTPYIEFGYPWKFVSPPENPCSASSAWQGVDCSSTCAVSACHITGLRLTNLGLKGKLPNTLNNLPSLSSLIMGQNDITGTIPQTLTHLTSLSTLILTNNKLTGPMLPSLGNVTSLINVLLGYNMFTGQIPSTFSRLTQVKSLELEYNFLSGTIPDAFHQLHQLQYFFLQSNLLTGSIPSFVGHFNDLIELQLSLNELTSTIPSSLSYLGKLEYLDVYETFITGTIPDSFSNMTELQVMFLSYNLLSGTIPASFGNISLLYSINLDMNFFTGTLPSSLGNLTKMFFFYISLNMLSGTIPESMTNMTVLKDIYLYSNYLTGSIPEGIFNLTELKYMYLDDNRFTGTIPDYIGNLKAMHQISLCENLLSGTIPSSLGNLNQTEYLFLFQNQFTGTLPSSLGNMTSIVDLSVSQNQFTGTVPSSLRNFSYCEIFELDRNRLTGTIPSSFVYLERAQTISLDSNFLVGNGIQFVTSKDLTIFYASNNLLTGTLSGLPPFLRLTAFDVSNNLLSGTLPIALFENCSRLQIVNLNNNALSGSIPASLFYSKGLLSVVLAVNCFTGFIPIDICDSFDLIQLILDGLHAAPYCTSRAIPGWSQSGLISTKDVSGTIPRCLFQLPSLSALHLGGNSFSGTIPDLPLSAKLNELVLASNELVGTIPSNIWYSNLTILDLSLNRLKGTIPSGFLPQAQLSPENSSIQLNVNQIAGTIPSGLQSMTSVNVLEGNMFSCDRNRNDIPNNDPEATTYQCGSDNTNYSLAGIALITIISFIVLYCVLKYTTILLNIRIMICTYDKYYANSNVDRQFSHQKQFIYITVGICCISTILYGILSVYFASYSEIYIWTVSAIFKIGFIPAIAMLIWFFIVLLAIVNGLPSTNTKTVVAVDETSSSNRDFKQLLKRWTGICLLMMLNIVLATLVNGLYVSAVVSDDYAHQVLIMISFLLSCFKITWNYGILRLSQNIEGIPDEVIILIGLFNNLLAPLLAELFVSSDCFLYVVSQAPPLNFQYQVYFCEFKQVDNVIRPICNFAYLIAQGGEPVIASMIPSFHYLYECSFSLISSYAYVFIFRYIQTSILEPMIDLAIIQGAKNLHATLGTSSWMRRICMKFLPMYWQVVIQLSVSKDSPDRFQKKLDSFERQLRNGDFRRRILTFIATDLSMIICFGVLFPPLAFLIALSALKDIMSIQLALGRYNNIMEKLQDEKLVAQMTAVRAVIDAELLKTDASIWKGLWYGMVISTWIWAFVLFDTSAATEGVNRGLYILIAMLSSRYLIHFTTVVINKLKFVVPTFNADIVSVLPDTNHNPLFVNDEIEMVIHERIGKTPGVESSMDHN